MSAGTVAETTTVRRFAPARTPPSRSRASSSRAGHADRPPGGGRAPAHPCSSQTTTERRSRRPQRGRGRERQHTREPCRRRGLPALRRRRGGRRGRDLRGDRPEPGQAWDELAEALPTTSSAPSPPPRRLQSWRATSPADRQAMLERSPTGSRPTRLAALAGDRERPADPRGAIGRRPDRGRRSCASSPALGPRPRRRSSPGRASRDSWSPRCASRSA